ncbi:cobyric acid synthase [Acidianus sp. HS-5]|uniref:cobyric acid synthase n=1 Tax=Acidianus sp. HS-5 TaxID=2886040 RepID=UPI001F02F4C7|nr:cobyric acid synthase [Acidianus sp. HS-5]BDC19573.1 cobyric acid synthase CobQ [Acidianus sp. HS-5]
MAIIISSTMSDSGKSLVTAGLVRILKGIPFKSQNMSLNSFPSQEGGEIAFIQAFQAIGANLKPRNSMNPVLLKPSTSGKIEVIFFGKSLGNLNPENYYTLIPKFWDKIKENIKENYVIEAAGGIEPNFMERDLTAFLPMKEGIPGILVLDIDRGGAFSSAYGVYQMLPPSVRGSLKGFIINKFRGSQSLLDSAIKWLNEKTGMKFLGVIPYLEEELTMPEDSMNIKDFGEGDEASIAIINYPYMSNFNEFFALLKSNASIRFINNPKKLRKDDIIILPGSRNTYESLIWLKERGFVDEIRKRKILGICGGFQIMGKKLIDPLGIESGEPREYEGLGMFDFTVKFDEEKVVSMSEGIIRNGKGIRGYEIRRGRINYEKDKPLLTIMRRNDKEVEIDDGSFKEDKLGLSIHGSLYSRNLLEDFGVKIYSKSMEEEIISMSEKIEKVLKQNVYVDEIKEIYTQGK